MTPADGHLGIQAEQLWSPQWWQSAPGRWQMLIPTNKRIQHEYKWKSSKDGSTNNVFWDKDNTAMISWLLTRLQTYCKYKYKLLVKHFFFLEYFCLEHSKVLTLPSLEDPARRDVTFPPESPTKTRSVLVSQQSAVMVWPLCSHDTLTLSGRPRRSKCSSHTTTRPWLDKHESWGQHKENTTKARKKNSSFALLTN